jgi:hypothetical protein
VKGQNACQAPCWLVIHSQQLLQLPVVEAQSADGFIISLFAIVDLGSPEDVDWVATW